MSEHKISNTWKRGTPDVVYETYDRTHTVRFEGGQTVKSSAAVAYLGKAEFTNPEELLIAALSACHMLTFLAVACKSKFVVDSYEDNAVAVLDKNANGKMAVVKTILRPKIVFGGDVKPDAAKIQEIHNKAHANCMIANSLQSEFVLEPVV